MGIDAHQTGRADGAPTAAATGQQAIGPYLRAVRRHWIIVLALTVLAGGIAAITATRAGYTYKGTANVLVTPLPQNPDYLGLGVVLDTGDPTRTIQTAAALLGTDDAAAATAAKLGSGWSSGQVQKSVSVDSLGQTNVLAVSGSASSPRAAAHLANTYTQTALAVHGRTVQANISAEIRKLQAQLAALPAGSPTTASQTASLSSQLGALEAARATGGDPTLSISQLAAVPTSHSGASHYLIILLALLGGFAVASIAALGIDFFGRPVKDEDELESLFPAPVLATIPKVSSRGRGPLSPWMFPPAAFEQVRMLRAQLDLGVKAPVIMVTSAGAGDGKTTLVAALAAAYAEGGGNVIVVDLDLHRPTLAKVLEIEQPDLSPGQPGVLISVPKLPNVKFLPLPMAAEVTPDKLMVRLPILLAQAQRAASCVILDTAPLGQISESLRIATMSEAVVFVARPGHTDRRLLVRARDLLIRSGARAAGLVLMGQSAPGAYGSYYAYGRDNRGPGQPVGGPAAARPERTRPAPRETAPNADGETQNGAVSDEEAVASGSGAESDEPS